MPTPKTQADIVAQDQMLMEKEVTENLRLPGLDRLHTKSKEEIAEVLVNILKSRQNITRIDWVLGGPMRVTYVR